jgi:gliding motility-associated-like protein
VLTAEVEGADQLLWNTGGTTESITVSQPGSYVITATNACGSATDGVTYSAVLPWPTIAPLDDVTLCPGSSAVLSAQVNDASSSVWSTGESAASIEVSTPGTYTITAVNACGSVEQSAVVSLADAAPVLGDLPDVIICPGEVAVLSVEVLGNAALLWSTGATTSTIEVSTAGIYTVTAGNACGTVSRSATVEQLVACVDEDDLVHLPNAFTPDGDGVNDAFMAVSGSRLTSFELQVFNRWGEVIWTATDPALGWDGQVDGTPAPDGVYVTRLAYRTEDRKDRVVFGHVVLLR